MPVNHVVASTEIPVTDLETSAGFYHEVFGFKMEIDTMGPNPMTLFSQEQAVGGQLYPGKPASDGGNTVHLHVPDTVEAAMARCQAAGGIVVSPVISIPAARRSANHRGAIGRTDRGIAAYDLSRYRASDRGGRWLPDARWL